MKSILSLASLTCLCSSLAYAAPEPISGLVGTITFTAKATISEGGVTKETKTEEAHQNAIDNNQDSTRTETYTPAVERFGNREILQATLETDDIKGWSLIFLESEAFSGLVAYKKGQTPIPVPESMVSFELAGFGPGLESGFFPYKQTETFTAKNHTTKGSYEVTYTLPTESVSLFELGLSGVDKGTFKVSFTEAGFESYTVAFAGNINLFGTDEIELGFQVLVEATLGYSLKSSQDISAYIPVL